MGVEDFSMANEEFSMGNRDGNSGEWGMKYGVSCELIQFKSCICFHLKSTISTRRVLLVKHRTHVEILHENI